MRIHPDHQGVLPYNCGLDIRELALAAGEEDSAWNNVLKKKYFGDRDIDETTTPIELTAPYRAEDPALVPVSITAKIPQTPNHYIKTITLIIDNNPVPFAAAFHFTPESGKADIATRLRFNAYTNIRAIAETNDGKLSMVKSFRQGQWRLFRSHRRGLGSCDGAHGQNEVQAGR